MQSHKVCTIERHTYLKKHGKWRPTDQTVKFDLFYSGADEREAMQRFLAHNKVREIAEVLDLVAWMETGFWNACSQVHIDTPFGSRTFKYIYQRRDTSGKPLSGSGYEPVYVTRNKVFKELARIILDWLQAISQ